MYVLYYVVAKETIYAAGIHLGVSYTATGGT
jgi:hypothetical protein